MTDKKTAWIAEEEAVRQEFGMPGTSDRETIGRYDGLGFLQAMLRGELPYPPIMETLNFCLIDCEKGRVTLQGTPQFAHYNPIGSVHGGYAATLLDSAMGLAVHSMLPAGTGYTTLEFKLSFIRGMTRDTGTVRTEGKTLHVGRRTAIAEARITDSKGRLLAHATTTCLVFEIPKVA
jgi:uncharacterized protein (TIGR00369 family)